MGVARSKVKPEHEGGALANPTHVTGQGGGGGKVGGMLTNPRSVWVWVSGSKVRPKHGGGVPTTNPRSVGAWQILGLVWSEAVDGYLWCFVFPSSD